MNRLDELMQKLSNGVEYRSFGEMTTIVRGVSPCLIKNFVTTDADGVNWIKIGDVKAVRMKIIPASSREDII